MSEWNQIDAGMLSRMATLNSIYRQNDSKPVSGFDPYQTLMRRKQMQDNSQDLPVMEYDPRDVEELEEFCRNHNILGFNFGKMAPKAALQMLKRKVGVVSEQNINKKLLRG